MYNSTVDTFIHVDIYSRCIFNTSQQLIGISKNYFPLQNMHFNMVGNIKLHICSYKDIFIN